MSMRNPSLILVNISSWAVVGAEAKTFGTGEVLVSVY